MKRAQWASAITGSVFAIAIAAVGVGMAVTNEMPQPVALVQNDDEAALAGEIWEVASRLVVGPVRADTLTETDGVTGRWYDDYRVPAVVAGKPGTLVVTRDLGLSEEIDAAVLTNQDQANVESVTVGFRPGSGETGWYWVRYAIDGTVLEDEQGRPFAGYFDANANSQCIARAWTGMAGAVPGSG